MYIATNKRYKPTMKIINYLKWNKYFKNIYSIDRYSLESKNKTNMLKILLEKEKILQMNHFTLGINILTILHHHQTKYYLLVLTGGK